jgi:hypothetical protein
MRTMSQDPAEPELCFTPAHADLGVAFVLLHALGTRNDVNFVAYLTARTFAYLRLAGCIAATFARFATDRGGFTLGRTASHPLDDSSEVSRRPRGPPFPLNQHCLVARKT